MKRRVLLLLVLLIAPPVLLWSQEAKEPPQPKSVTGKIVAVTVYRDTALVTREVPVPDAAGQSEITVTPLPPNALSTSLYAEGSDGIRILSTRYRTRAIAEDNREEVRKLESKIKENNKKSVALSAEVKTLTENTAFLGKLENFTSATLNSLTDKGQLDAEKTIALVTFIRETRTKASKELVVLQQQIQTLLEETAFTQRTLDEVAGGVTRTERDAIVVIDKAKLGAGTVKLFYLVSNANWKPQYKLRAGLKDKDPTTIEYLAAIAQQTGEDWNGVALTLSTARPMLNAAPPDLLALEITIGGPQYTGGPGKGMPQVPGVPNAALPSAGGMPPGSAYLRGLEEQSRGGRSAAQGAFNNKDEAVGNKLANDAAALEQYRDLLVSREDISKLDPSAEGQDLPSVTYTLKTRFSLPSRADDQVIEIAKLDLAPKFYYKALPVLTTNVYRIAELTNTTDLVLLPGEATMYLGTDFVGQTKLPLVAVGKPFSVGFGVDPQIQVTRKLMDKTRTTQGGNQVLTFKYRILLSSYKTGTADVQVWDRMPHAEAANAIAVSILKGETELSKDALYVRDERTKNLLRWDVKLEPKQNGEKTLAIDYEYKMEFEKSVSIGAFLAK